MKNIILIPLFCLLSLNRYAEAEVCEYTTETGVTITVPNKNAVPQRYREEASCSESKNPTAIIGVKRDKNTYSTFGSDKKDNKQNTKERNLFGDEYKRSDDILEQRNKILKEQLEKKQLNSNSTSRAGKQKISHPDMYSDLFE